VNNKEKMIDHSSWRLLPPTTTLEELTDILQNAGIPLDEYGKGRAKHVANLYEELVGGESRLRVNDLHEISRSVTVVWVDVVCTLENGDVYILREDRQEFHDGRIKKRTLPSSLGEKLKDEEDLDGAAVRALQEELGVNEVENLYAVGSKDEQRLSDTYPGLANHYSTHSYVAVIPATSFQPKGYVEYQAEKNNFYVWELLHSANND
jgi:ADP-ribose pyrophosphatase YjhB (NUDIX family)